MLSSLFDSRRLLQLKEEGQCVDAVMYKTLMPTEVANNDTQKNVTLLQCIKIAAQENTDRITIFVNQEQESFLNTLTSKAPTISDLQLKALQLSGNTGGLLLLAQVLGVLFATPQTKDDKNKEDAINLLVNLITAQKYAKLLSDINNALKQNPEQYYLYALALSNMLADYLKDLNDLLLATDDVITQLIDLVVKSQGFCCLSQTMLNLLSIFAFINSDKFISYSDFTNNIVTNNDITYMYQQELSTRFKQFKNEFENKLSELISEEQSKIDAFAKDMQKSIIDFEKSILNPVNEIFKTVDGIKVLTEIIGDIGYSFINFDNPLAQLLDLLRDILVISIIFPVSLGVTNALNTILKDANSLFYNNNIATAGLLWYLFLTGNNEVELLVKYRKLFAEAINNFIIVALGVSKEFAHNYTSFNYNLYDAEVDSITSIIRVYAERLRNLDVYFDQHRIVDEKVIQSIVSSLYNNYQNIKNELLKSDSNFDITKTIEALFKEISKQLLSYVNLEPQTNLQLLLLTTRLDNIATSGDISKLFDFISLLFDLILFVDNKDLFKKELLKGMYTLLIELMFITLFEVTDPYGNLLYDLISTVIAELNRQGNQLHVQFMTEVKKIIEANKRSISTSKNNTFKCKYLTASVLEWLYLIDVTTWTYVIYDLVGVVIKSIMLFVLLFIYNMNKKQMIANKTMQTRKAKVRIQFHLVANNIINITKTLTSLNSVDFIELTKKIIKCADDSNKSSQKDSSLKDKSPSTYSTVVSIINEVNILISENTYFGVLGILLKLIDENK